MNDAKQVIVWRNDLKVRKGKFAAQISHASIAFMTNRMVWYPENKDHDWHYTHPVAFSSEERQWIEDIFKKIVLKVNSEDELLEIYEQALGAEIEAHLITDSGLTEFKELTNTCVALGPDDAEKIDKITGHLGLM